MKNYTLLSIAKYAAIILIVIVIICIAIQSGYSGDSSNNNDIQGEDIFTGIDIFSLSEYELFIETSKILPENFVTMDMLESFGTFYGFVWNPEQDYSRYTYSVTLENDKVMFIYVEHDPEIKTKNYLDISQVGETMLKIDTNQKGTIVSNGMEFNYVSGGGLISVSWMVNGVEIKIGWNAALENAPPLSENHILNKIFSKSSDDQIAALNQLKAKMENN